MHYARCSYAYWQTVHPDVVILHVITSRYPITSRIDPRGGETGTRALTQFMTIHRGIEVFGPPRLSLRRRVQQYAVACERPNRPAKPKRTVVISLTYLARDQEQSWRTTVCQALRPGWQRESIQSVCHAASEATSGGCLSFACRGP